MLAVETTVSPVVRFSVRDFAPGWGASVMGTSVISAIFSAMVNGGLFPAVSGVLAQVFLALALLIATPVLGITAARWVLHPREYLSDMRHPVKGGMSATFPGGFLVLGAALGGAGAQLLGQATATFLAYLFIAVGAVLSVLVGLVFLTELILRGNTQPQMITGSWFIPPVVTVVVPVALAPLLSEQGPITNELLWLSWMFLGIGSLLYFMVAVTLFHRSVTHPLPPAPMAPSLVIGMGPISLIGLDLLLLTRASARLGFIAEDLVGLATAAGVMLWGFGLWWGVASVIVIARGYDKIPFGVPSWGFTFPVGAWVVSGLTLGAAAGSSVIVVIALVGLVAFLAIWGAVLLRTAKGIANGTIWG